MTALAYDTQRRRGTERTKFFSVSRCLCVLFAVAVASTVLVAANDLRLIEAIKARNAEAVRSLLKEKVDVNSRQGDGAAAS